MIRVYTAPGSRSGRMVVQWLKENNLSFIEKNIFSSDLRINEIRELLERCENGTDDIISKNSKIIKALKIDLNNMKMEDLINFIKNNPSILKRPIIMDEHHFLVGYNEEEIRIFIPRSQRRKNSEF
ncbi:Spx/MgsR family RNA polymerase-binding regulatory protein [Thomasclavelia cocleata]|jgi:regulatory protein spx|uniref:regulatory protein SPX n=1 Tax=Thomasclavelia cocleata TaxID=69824 RepID=A0A1I0GJF3_9FIRM|nr:Spx/MgsR family RNA polymerase-binding regulatory protein [Thomasclavelia cocleata]MCI9131353.1 transcriptional regulator Spx [Thomasclavelia cocleata]MCI9631105.1 transcriptional regulator Spx [Thomasclavelia cocleata]MCR1961800.1 Spx/MgsR family RNA polymerase-binding regulatory protein [Thomasclavelia cocleata]NDO43252.1 Spx/MgsR family RNA polymerase-binding regulatory protein [Thomasclavelia cocleata]PJN81797.1 transcriptional regulator Spx [Thomasclavelia cocleata]